MTSHKPSAQTQLGLEMLKQNLKETNVWCHEFASLPIAAQAIQAYLSQYTAPSDFFLLKQDGRNLWRTLGLALPLQEWNDHISEKSPDSLSTVVWTLFDRRREVMRLQNSAFHAPKVAGQGRLLITESSESLFDSASKAGTFGFFDLWDIPSWDTWVWYEPVSGDLFGGGVLLSWVIPPLFELVQNGIDINASGCIEWADKLDTSFTRHLRANDVIIAF